MQTALKLRLPTVELRTPAIEDAAILSRLGIETFTETFGALYPAADLQQFLATTYPLHRMQSELADPTSLHLIAWLGDEPAGFMKARDNTLPLTPLRSPQMEIQRLYVRKACQGLGIGKALIEAAIGGLHARGAQEITISVWEKNAKAIAFYARFGFAKAGEHRFQVGSQIDRELILRRIG